MGNLVECPHCKKLVDGDKQICAYCGQKTFDVSWVDYINDLPINTLNKGSIKEESLEYEEPKNEEEKLNDLLKINEKKQKKKLSKKSILFIILGTLFLAALIVLLIIRSFNNKAFEYYRQNLNKYSFSKAHIIDDMSTNGFSANQIEYAIEKNNVNFEKNALKYLSLLVSSDTYPQKKDMIDFLNAEGFTDNEINYALENLNMDNFVEDFCKNYLEKVNLDDKKEKLSGKNKILDSFKKIGMSTDEINYVKTKLNWNDLSYQCAIDYLNNKSQNKDETLSYLSDCGYDINEVKYAKEKIKWEEYARKCIDNYIKENEIDKKAILEYLQECGYSDEEIDLALFNFDWKNVALDFANDYIEHADVAVSRLDVYNHLIDNLFTDVEISFALNKIDFDELCVKYLEKLIEKDYLSNSFKCINKTNNIDLLTKGGFENDDVNKAKDSVDWQDCANKSIEKLIKYAQDNDYDISSYGKNSLKSILNNAGYSPSEVTVALESVDWIDLGTTFIKNCIKNKNYDKRLLNNKLVNSGLASNEIDKVLKSIDWKAAALEYAKSLNRDYYDTSERLYNCDYSDSEVDYALSKIDWNKRAVDCANNNKSLSRYALRSLLSQHDFSFEQINYAINNCDIDFKENAFIYVKDYGPVEQILLERESIENNLRTSEYTDEEIEYAFTKLLGV